MRNKRNLFASIAVLASFAGVPAQADITVTGSATFVIPAVISYGTDGWVVTVYAYGNPGGTVIVQADDSNDPIESITIVPQSNPPFTSSQLNLSLTVRPKPSTPGSIPYLGSISRSGTAGDLWIGSVNVQGTIGKPASPHSTSITAQSINDITASSHIAGDIVSLGSAQVSGAVGIVTSGGNITGHVKAENSTINKVLASGTIGVSSGSQSNIWAKSGITRVEGSTIYANIQANKAGSGGIQELVTNSGDLVGSLSANHLSGSFGVGMDIAGDLDADVTFADFVYDPITIDGDILSGATLTMTNGFGTTAPINIGGSLAGDITVGAGDLLHQININAANGSGTWTGDVTVGSTTLSAIPYYSQLSTPLGGGSVGLVPFNFHGAECNPINATGLNSPPTQVLIEHYGPVSIPTGNPPVTVEEAEDSWPIGGSPSWSDVTANYDYAIASGTGRKLQITPKSGQAFHSGSLYRISPAGASSTNRLRCSGVTGSPEAVYVYDATQDFFDNYYHFAVYFSGFDLNQSGDVDSDDVMLWLLAPVDLDEDDDADLDDLELLQTEAGF